MNESSLFSYVKRFLLMYGVWLVLFFVVETFVVHGLGFENGQFFFWLLRDGVRWLFVLWLLSRRGIWTQIVSFVKVYRWILGCVVGLAVWSLGLAWWYDMSFFAWFVGFKYDRYFLVIVCSALFVGRLLKSTEVVEMRDKDMLRSVLSCLVYVVVAILGAGVVWQLLKVGFPDFFIEYMGYGGFGDFVPGESPPLYYKTGSGGLMRLSGLFVGPNVLGFFLVVVIPFLYVGLQKIGNRSKLLRFLVWMLWGGCLLLTFSRGAYVASLLSLLGCVWFLGTSLQTSLLQGEVLHSYSRGSWRKVGVSILLVVCVGVLTWGVNFLKSGSNHERGSGNSIGWDMVQENMWGYGPGVAGPARHYWADYSDHEKHALSLVENVYLQLGVNMGIPGLLLYALFWLNLLCMVWKRVKWHGSEGNGMEGSERILIACMIPFVALNIEGVVLHVWRDSQFNFLFLIFIGLLVGCVMKEKVE